MKYNLESLISKLEPYKTSVKQLDVGDVFIHIIIGTPKSHINLEYIKLKNKYGDAITISDKAITGFTIIYKYCEQTIDIVQNWNKGHNFIKNINENLIHLNLLNLAEVDNHIQIILREETNHG